MALNIDKLQAAPWGAPLLEDISLKLDVGDILGIIGPNGAGKTSLLNVLTGDLPGNGGSVELLGKPLQAWEAHARAQLVATLPQLSLLNFPYRAEEVVMLGRTPHSSGINLDRAIVYEAMQATDTTQLQGRIYTQLSGGEKQRVQLARVFAQIWPQDDRPRLLLLDEPTAALDLAHQKMIVDTLRELSGKGCTVILVAHDFNLIASLADQITALKNGRALAQGAPHAVLTPANFRDIFSIEVQIVPHPVNGRPLVISL